MYQIDDEEMREIAPLDIDGCRNPNHIGYIHSLSDWSRRCIDAKYNSMGSAIGIDYCDGANEG